MKVLAYADNFITAEMLEKGLIALEDAGHTVEIRDWSHPSKELLQKDNLAVEQGGANAVELDDEFTKGIEEFDIIITQFTPLGKSTIEKAKHLKYIGVLRGGIENVDVAAAGAAGVKIQNTPGRNARAVAEFTVGMMLAETRNIARTHAAMKQHIWLKDFPNGADIPEIGGKTVGLVGLGNIGHLVAQFVSGFDAKVIFYDSYMDGNPTPYEKVDTLEELMERSDVVSLHLRMSDESYHIISRDLIAKMKPSAYLVNTARSGLIDEEAMLDALEERRIAGAAIDTFDHEPLEEGSRFLTLDNVTITSHLAGSTADAFKNTPKLLSALLLKDLV